MKEKVAQSLLTILRLAPTWSTQKQILCQHSHASAVFLIIQRPVFSYHTQQIIVLSILHMLRNPGNTSSLSKSQK